MQQTSLSLTLRAIGLGAVAGLRSLTAPALVSYAVGRRHDLPATDTPLATLASPPVTTALCALALGELVVDKLPIAPNRTIAPSVAFRAGTGALVGAALFASQKRSPVPGAIVGALAAVAATFGAYYLRQAVDKKTGLPDPLVAVAEDAIAIVGGISLARAIAP